MNTIKIRKKNLTFLPVLFFLSGILGFSLEPGESVEVLWQGTWYNAEIIKIEENKYYIHYTGYSDSWDEWVTKERIRDLGEKEKIVPQNDDQSFKEKISIWKHETHFAEIDDRGIISISGTRAGKMSLEEGTIIIWKNGTEMGRISPDGMISTSKGEIIGRIESYGEFYYKDRYIGEFSGENIWIDGFVWGFSDVYGTYMVMKKISAILIFFTAIPEMDR